MEKKTLSIISFVALLIGSLFYIYLSAMSKEKIDINKMLSSPNEYINSPYLSNLTDNQKSQVISSFNVMLEEKCKNGILNENCTKHFLYFYVNTRLILEKPIEARYRGILTNAYLDLKSNVKALTENDLKGFIVPLLTGFCKIDIFNETEKIYWQQKLFDINKTSWEYNDKHIYYLQQCMGISDIAQLAGISTINLQAWNSRICDIPDLKDIDTSDLCYVTDYLNIKNFCKVPMITKDGTVVYIVNITSEDKTLIESLLSKEYNSNYQNGCKLYLSESYGLVS